MSLDNLIATGQPVELYLWTANTQTWAYTNAGSAISYLSYSFQPEAITRSGISQTQDTFKGSVNIKFPLSNSFARGWLAYPPDFPVSLTIYREDATATSFDVYWKGRMVAPRGEDSKVVLEHESIFVSQSQFGLKDRIGTLCRRVLYSADCTVNRESYAVPKTVLSVSGKTVTFSSISQADGYFTTGILKDSNGVERMITSHSGTSITLTRPISGLGNGDSVTLYPGCDRTYSVCETRFLNGLNHGGFPNLPPHSPYDGRSIV